MEHPTMIVNTEHTIHPHTQITGPPKDNPVEKVTDNEETTATAVKQKAYAIIPSNPL
jgi:hypothetical protein